MGADVTIVRAGAERLDDLEPLWKVLQEHHTSVAPTLGGFEARSPDEAWTRRRAKYEKWLRDPDAFVLLAERGGRPVGYALVTVGESFQGWATGERVADVETLSVLPDVRGAGVGTLLMDAVEDALAHVGIEALQLLVVAPNAEAIRFYERRGLTMASNIMLGRVGN